MPLGAAQHLDPAAGIDEQWWRSLGSPHLNALFERAQRNSPTLAAARAKMALARELHAARAGSSQYPQVRARLSARRLRASLSTFGSSAGAQAFGVYKASKFHIPDVPHRLLLSLRQAENGGLGRRVRRVIDHYVLYLARIIGRAKQEGLVRPDIQPYSAANLVGAIQAPGLRTHVAPHPRELLLREAAEVFALFAARCCWAS